MDEEGEDVHEYVTGQEAGEQRHAPFEGEVFCFHVDVPEMGIQFGTVFLNALLEDEVHYL